MSQLETDWYYLHPDIDYAIKACLGIDVDVIEKMLLLPSEMSLPIWVGLNAVKEAKTEERSTQSSVTYRHAVNLARRLLGKPPEPYCIPSLRN